MIVMAHKTQRSPLRCLVIQMARLGDTVQSLMALKAVKELYPELQIHFLARESFAHAAQKISWIDTVHTFPGEDILNPVLKAQGSEKEALQLLAHWVRPLVSSTWDIVANWTYSEASSYLTGLMPSRIKLGYSRGKDIGFLNVDGWSHYVQAIVQGKLPQSIHLTDILTTQLITALQINFRAPVDPGLTTVTSKDFFTLQPENYSTTWQERDRSKKWIAIQLGAASEDKTWAPEKWAQLASLIRFRHPECRFVLLGGKAEESLASSFIDSWLGQTNEEEELINLVGKTNFDSWSHIISQSQWLFSADTAAIHIASVLGTRVLNLSIGPVRWAETGPYGNGHYVIHSANNSISPESAYGTWSYGSSEWAHRRQFSIKEHFTRLGYSSLLNHSLILRSRIRDVSEGGGVNYESLNSHPLTLDEWSARVTDYMARAWYCGWTPPVGAEIKREAISPQLLKDLRALGECSRVLGQVLQQGQHTAESIHHKSADIKNDRVMTLDQKTELHQLAEKLTEIDLLLSRTVLTHAALRPIENMFKVMMHSLPGKRLSEIGYEASLCYKQLTEGNALLGDWVKHSLSLVRPMVLHNPLLRPQQENDEKEI